MIRLHAVVEGQTEETFVNTVLKPEMWPRNVLMDAHCVTTGPENKRADRGGIQKYQQLKADLISWMKQERQSEVWFTTMIDLYALPLDFPGYDECARKGNPTDRVECLERRLADDIQHRQFIPYIQLHEFEALLFSDVSEFAVDFPGDDSAVDRLIRIREQFPNPEEIDDSPKTAPSKRILEVLPDYEKTVAGPAIAERIGLLTLRRECRHFNSWIERIEAASKQ